MNSESSFPNTRSVAIVDAAITSRRSIRAFLPRPVPREMISDILQVAATAPSGTNTQPWRVTVVTGEVKNNLEQKLLAVYRDPVAFAQCHEEYPYYPESWKSPYIERRRKVGLDLYGLLGIGKDNKDGMFEQHARNYLFFDAPVGLMFSLDKVMGRGSLIDYGMFMQNIMVAARARGLDTCAQAAFCPLHQTIRECLDIPDSFYIVCGMALGYADTSKIENTLTTERVPAIEFTRFLGD